MRPAPSSWLRFDTICHQQRLKPYSTTRIWSQLLFLLCALSVVGGASGASFSGAAERSWSDDTGRFHVEAELIEATTEAVRLRKASGEIITVPLDRLSTKDQAYIREKLANAPPPKAASIGAVTYHELAELASRQRYAKQVVELFEAFLASPAVKEKEKEQARRRLSRWRELAKQKAVRAGEDWLTPAEVAERRKNAAELIAQALRLIEVGQDALAKEKLVEASKADPNGVKADFILGLLHALVAHHAQSAEEHFEECVKRLSKDEPGDTVAKANKMAALNNLALAEVRLNRFSAAMRHWKEAADHAIVPPELVQNLGRFAHLSQLRRFKHFPPTIAKQCGDLYAAVAVANQAVEFEENTGWLYMMLLTPSREHEEPEEAKTTAGGEGDLRTFATGTAFVVAPGILLTNRHVVEDADAVQVVNPAAKTRYPGNVLAIHEELDLALVACEAVQAPAVPLRAAMPRRGADIMVLGYPKSQLLGISLKATRGTITSLPDETINIEDARNMCIIDAAANPGNSGGPVCNEHGSAIGVLTAITLTLESNYSLCIPTVKALPFIKKHVPGYRQLPAAEQSLEWPDVDEAIAPSTYLLEVQCAAVKFPVNPESHAQQRQWKAYEDPWCMACNGHGKVECPYRGCSRGTVNAYRPRVVGVNPVTGARVTDAVRVRVRCKMCDGESYVECPECHDGIDLSLD